MLGYSIAVVVHVIYLNITSKLRDSKTYPKGSLLLCFFGEIKTGEAILNIMEWTLLYDI